MNCGAARKIAHYRCTRCSHEWREPPSWKICCPNCGELYVKWMNYDQDFAPAGLPRPAAVTGEQPSLGDRTARAGDAAARAAPVPLLHTSGGDAGSPSTPTVDEIPRAAPASSGKDAVIGPRRLSSSETPATAD